MFVPAFGRVEGGRLNGYRYCFYGFLVRDRKLLIDVMLSRPHWPFPSRQLIGADDYALLCAVTGERAKRIPADDLVLGAWRSYAESINVDLLTLLSEVCDGV